jgi:hypothetical protein
MGVLRLSSPADKHLARALEPSWAERVGQGKGCVPLALTCQQHELGENSLSLLKAHVDLPAELAVLAQRCSRGSAQENHTGTTRERNLTTFTAGTHHPVRRRNPSRGRFESCAAPLGESPAHTGLSVSERTQRSKWQLYWVRA